MAEAAVQEKPIKVQAIREGYYLHKRRVIGEIFWIESRKEFSEKWMIEYGKQQMPKVVKPLYVTANQKGGPSSGAPAAKPGVQGYTGKSQKEVPVETAPPDFSEQKEPARQPAEQVEQSQDAGAEGGEPQGDAPTGDENVI